MPTGFELDYYRMTGEKYRLGARSIVHYLYSHQIRYMRWWRKAKAHGGGLFYRAILKRYALKYGIEISMGATIGKGLYLGHPYNITVGDATLGDNVNLHKGCTIGRENRGKRAGCPTIGNNVTVGINATIVGNVKIGNDVMIAPNSFVNFDVPDHSVVVGNPGVIHSRKDATRDYISFSV